ncbi:MAG: hypothetical protein ACJ8AO_09135, partial [Gemmatimonadaceae bacterium]
AGSEIDGGSLDRLFGGSAVAPDDDEAANSLASAFAVGDETSPPGKPTRPADEELSLDHVFRAPPRAAPKAPSASVTPSSPAPQTVPQSAPAGRGAPGGSFSFDQFFAEVGGASAPPEATSADPGDVAASDIEQFNAWLEGLKKK